MMCGICKSGKTRKGKARVTLRRGGRTPAQAALPPLSAEETNEILSLFR